MPITPAKRSEFSVMLRANTYFGALDTDEIEALARLCSTRPIKAGVTLFQQGDTGDAMYGVRRGSVTIEVGPADGQRIVIATLGAGDIFGEVALLDGRGRTADAVIAEASELFVLRRADVLAYIERAPRVAIKLIEIICLKLRSTLGQLEQTLTLKLDVRLAGRLLTLVEDFGETLIITQEQLARHVGVTRESVNRQLQAWQADGIVDLRRGRIVIKNEAKLRAAARSPS
jgi:CRP/FNR family cyclic AMP-dependent transcriptional regulator